MSDSNLWARPFAPGLPSMLMPTLDPNELEKRINDLKTVEHWLDMNRALLHSTIQTLEMQRNAIVAMQAMAQPAPSASATPGPGSAAPTAASEGSGAASGAPPFNPVMWWNLLQEQFARVASAAATQAQSADAAPQAPTTPPAGDPPGGQRP